MRKSPMGKQVSPLAARGPVQSGLPGLVHADKTPTPGRRTEAAFQQQARQMLSNLGYATMEAGKARKKMKCTCERCGHEWEQYPVGWQGNTPGFPDVVAFRYAPESFPPIGMFLELKGLKTKIEVEQQRLADSGRSSIVRSLAETVEAVIAAEDAMHTYRFDERRRDQLVRFLAENDGHLW